jgi:lysophospholipase L1-like esterase
MTGLSSPAIAEPADNRAIWEQFPVRIAEPVLFIRHSADAAPEGNLLFKPKRLLRAYAANRSTEFPVTDFDIIDRKIVYKGKEKIPSLNANELFPPEKTARSIGMHTDGKRYLLYSEGRFFHGNQICFDYETGETWAGITPVDQSARLPRLQAKLKNREMITVVLLGDSISAGANATGRMNVAPGFPPYSEQFVRRLKEISDGPVELHNLSRGGKSSPWGCEQVNDIKALKPALFIIAFGMNDASARYPVEKYIKNIKTVIDAVRQSVPDAEYTVVSSMTPNPFWNLDNPDYRMEYHKELRKMAAPHIAFCDVRTSWLYMLEKKNYLDLSGNGINHPNDFGHRLYADVLVQTVLGPSAWNPR